MDSNVKLGSELESFREQWLSDLRSRNTHSVTQQQAGPSSSIPPPRPDGPPRKTDPRKPARIDDDEDYIQALPFDAPPRAESSDGLVQGDPGKAGEKQLISALDHYEEAVEKEALGSLGDSLKLYRKAFRVSSLTVLQTFWVILVLTLHLSWTAVSTSCTERNTFPSWLRNRLERQATRV